MPYEVVDCENLSTANLLQDALTKKCFVLYFRTILERDVDIPKEKVTNYLLQVLWRNAIKRKIIIKLILNFFAFVNSSFAGCGSCGSQHWPDEPAYQGVKAAFLSGGYCWLHQGKVCEFDHVTFLFTVDSRQLNIALTRAKVDFPWISFLHLL